MKPLIRIDHREMHTPLARYLQLADVEFDVISLKTGDIEIGDRVLIERKRHSDLCRSVVDKRLFRQAHRLIAAAPSPIILIEGEEGHHESIHRNALQGALASIAIDLGIAILHSRNARDTVNLLEMIAAREMKRSLRLLKTMSSRLQKMEEEMAAGEMSRHTRFQRPGSGSFLLSDERRCVENVQGMLSNLHPQPSKKIALLPLDDGRLRILQAFPGIGPRLSRRLLQYFDDLASVLSASHTTLCDAGLSPAVALKMQRLFGDLNHQ